MPIAQGVMEIASVDLHPQLKERLQAFRIQAQENIHELVRKQKVSGSLPVMNLLGSFLSLPERLEIRNENPFNDEYEKEYSLHSFFSNKFRELKRKESPESEKLLVNMMISYDRFWRSGILERVRAWERDNLLPMSPEEFKNALTQIFQKKLTTDANKG